MIVGVQKKIDDSNKVSHAIDVYIDCFYVN